MPYWFSESRSWCVLNLVRYGCLTYVLFLSDNFLDGHLNQYAATIEI